MVAYPKELIQIWEALGGDDYAMVAGGAVRDTILERPISDWDLATRLSPSAVIHHIAFHCGDATFYKTGIAHGTVTVKLNNFTCEVTTLRRDLECDGRHATVWFDNVSFEEDAKRRDFTMNALFMGMNGNIVDFVGGVSDIELGIIRFVGDTTKRIEEDALRILRMFRFAARLDFQIDEKNLTDVVGRVRLLDNISRERVWSELRKILDSESPWHVLSMMKDFGILPDIIRHTDPCYSDNPLVRLYRISYSLEGLQEKLALSNKEFDFLVKYEEIFLAAPTTLEKFALFLYRSGYDVVSAYVEDIESHYTRSALRKFITKHRDRTKLPITGGDVMALGYSGKEIGAAIRKMEDLWCASLFQMKRSDLLAKVK